MTPLDDRHNDTKLLLGIAGLVVAGTAGIALLAGWSVSGDHQPTSARTVESRTVRTGTPTRQAATPAAHQREQPALIEPVDFEPSIPMAVEPIVPPSEPEPAADSAFVPGTDENLVARGVETYNAREYDKAVGYWQAEVDARPQRAWSQYMLALSLWKHGRPDEAAVAMDASIAADPTSVKSFVNLARIRNDCGEFEAALQAARAGLELVPDDPSAQFLAARSLFNLERYDEAETELIASLAGDPDNGFAQNLLGLVFLKQARELEAIVAFEKAAELRPDTAFIRNNLGMALELAGERSEAVASYAKAIELDPSHARAASNLARLQPEGPVEAPALTVAVAGGGNEDLRP